MSKKTTEIQQRIQARNAGVARSSDKTDRQLERNLGLSPGSLYNWRKQQEGTGVQAFPDKGRLKADDEYVLGLERELALVQQERDILKKALAIFTRSVR